jgi:phosphate transport system permease protein
MPSTDPELDLGETLDLSAERPRRERFRILKDRLFATIMGIGGVAVILAILLIFIYLFYVVAPLFASAEIAFNGQLKRSDGTEVAHVALDEYGEVGLEISPSAGFRFFSVADGKLITSGNLLGDGPAAHKGSALAFGAPSNRTLFAATADGRVTVAQADYAISYPDDVRAITPSIVYPLGAEPLVVDPQEQGIRLLAGQSSEEETTLVAITDDGRVVLLHVLVERSFLDDEVTLETTQSELSVDGTAITHIALDIDQRELYLVSAGGLLSLFDVSDKADIQLLDRITVVAPERRVTALAFLAGGISILIGDDSGAIAQWFPVRDANNNISVARVREFTALPGAITNIAPEYFRKAFAAIDGEGNLALYHTTAGRLILSEATGHNGTTALALSPRADAALIATHGGEFANYQIANEHPEVSFHSLWQEVWYESREQPEYIWQSSSASSDFEPKFSLTPLTFGTIKASVYSMLFAVPLAVLGAIYTAYFMTPALRNIVKPSIEVMAALPTVILGFLAGLWLAPLIERELLGLSLALVVVPLAVVAAARIYSCVPERLRRFTPEGWEALLLVPVLILATWASLSSGSVLEVWWFGGSLPQWLNDQFGITYDQRNSLVVGIAIGFAVIPTIFSISEDAVFSVPRSLTMGSLALGATPWQTALRVVLLTASPGIFSAIMIGMGRAVGETMIVLMATGNTPIMDLNIFQGFRALSANIAVEMPESEVHSTHYRVLFLAALVLFLVTFAVNTVAEVVRQRLRRKYASL